MRRETGSEVKALELKVLPQESAKQDERDKVNEDVESVGDNILQAGDILPVMELRHDLPGWEAQAQTTREVQNILWAEDGWQARADWRNME